MRVTALVTLALLAIPAIALLPTAEARTVYCTDLRSSSCPGIVCVDTSLDGSIQSDECVDMYCGVAGCCIINTGGCCGTVCPPPPASDPASPEWIGVCTEKKVGGTPVAVTVEYGTGVGCLGATYTTCRLSYYPGEPNTPVWVCTTKRVL